MSDPRTQYPHGTRTDCTSCGKVISNNAAWWNQRKRTGRPEPSAWFHVGTNSMQCVPTDWDGGTAMPPEVANAD